MLVLSRRRNESIVITHPDGTRVVVTVVDPRGDKIRIGINAPKDVMIDREEIHLAKARESHLEEGDTKGYNGASRSGG